MRRILYALTLLTALTACDNGAAPDPQGQLTGRLDGATWSGNAMIGIGPSDGGLLMSVTREGSVSRSISVDLFDATVGTHEIPAGGAWYQSATIGSSSDPYVAVATGGTMVITEVSPGGDRINGMLEITFSDGERVIHFENGAFIAMPARRLF
jgi:hypothetical protein